MCTDSLLKYSLTTTNMLEILCMGKKEYGRSGNLNATFFCFCPNQLYDFSIKKTQNIIAQGKNEKIKSTSLQSVQRKTTVH